MMSATVGDYLLSKLPNATLRVIQNIGHCPHLSAPQSIAAAMNDFF
jgi:sigma-B regulation protein RsbQ